MNIIISFIVAMCATFANSNAIVETNDASFDFSYIEFHDVRDSSNNFFNLRMTYELCAQINQTKLQYDKCTQHALNRAISIDA